MTNSQQAWGLLLPPTYLLAESTLPILAISPLKIYNGIKIPINSKPVHYSGQRTTEK
jgi:hypothetical protein